MHAYGVRELFFELKRFKSLKGKVPKSYTTSKDEVGDQNCFECGRVLYDDKKKYPESYENRYVTWIGNGAIDKQMIGIHERCIETFAIRFCTELSKIIK